ncbi:MAG: MarR family transcriptional regulator [Clostridia bacterium]|nr:MarR family transcriptional regulator [Clostridia bacterium]
MEHRYETFTVLVNRINRNINRIKTREMSAFGLRGAHVSCMYQLYLTQGLTASELCELCAEDKAAVSRSLVYLEKEGYITFQTKQAKRYKTPIYLTEKGVETGRMVAEKIDGILAGIGKTMTEDERNNLYRYLTDISSTLEAMTAGENQGGNEACSL